MFEKSVQKRKHSVEAVPICSLSMYTKASDIDHKSSVLNKHLQKSSVYIFKEIIHAQLKKK